jgi:hypothetical protein
MLCFAFLLFIFFFGIGYADFFILRGGKARMLFEECREIVGVREHKHIRDLEKVFIGILDEPFCLVELHLIEIVYDRATVS